MRTTANHQFALALRHQTTDQRVLHQNFQGSDDLANALPRIRHLMADQMIENAIKIFCKLWCQFDAGHRQRANLRATGRLATSPAMRDSR